MGWISDRFARNRAKWGRPVSDKKRRAPLRRITSVIRSRQGLFDRDYVELECGHVAFAYGDHRARCVRCLDGEDPPAPGGTG